LVVEELIVGFSMGVGGVDSVSRVGSSESSKIGCWRVPDKKKLYHFIVLSLGINKLAEDQRPAL